MPAVSQAQQSLMAQAYAIKIKKLKESDLDPRYRDEIVKLANQMTLADLKKYASTKHKNLPHHVKESEEETNESEVKLDPVLSPNIPNFQPKGPGKIFPFLDPDSKQKKKGQKNLQNLKDYRDWISSR